MGSSMDIELRFAVQDLLARYVHAIDDDRLEAWPDFFTAQGRYRVTTAENADGGLPLSLIYANSRAMMNDRISALRHANIYEKQRYRHVLGATLVERIDEGHLRAVSTFVVTRIMHTGETSLFATGRYEDRIALGDGGDLRFAERIVVLDSRQVDTLLAIPL